MMCVYLMSHRCFGFCEESTWSLAYCADHRDGSISPFCVSCLLGGVSMVSQRHATANNPYMNEYDPTAPSSYIMYLDANNLYGWAMSQPLPVSSFEWVGSMMNMSTIRPCCMCFILLCNVIARST